MKFTKILFSKIGQNVIPFDKETIIKIISNGTVSSHESTPIQSLPPSNSSSAGEKNEIVRTVSASIRTSASNQKTRRTSIKEITNSCSRKVIIKGRLDTLELPIHDFIDISVQDSKIALKIKDENNEKQKAMWGTTRAHINRMVQGVQDGYTLPIRMVGVGYRALMEQGKLSLKIGVSHPVLIEIPKGINVSIPAPQLVILQGADWPKITQFAAQVSI